eukprot:74222-Chlamydomonas_euryale.AAC.1
MRGLAVAVHGLREVGRGTGRNKRAKACRCLLSGRSGSDRPIGGGSAMPWRSLDGGRETEEGGRRT